MIACLIVAEQKTNTVAPLFSVTIDLYVTVVVLTPAVVVPVCGILFLALLRSASQQAAGMPRDQRRRVRTRWVVAVIAGVVAHAALAALAVVAVWAAVAAQGTMTVVLAALIFVACIRVTIRVTGRARGPALLVAAYEGQHAVVRLLLDVFGAALDSANDAGWTAAMVAAQQGHLEVLRCLSARGADLDAADVNGLTPVFASAAGGHLRTTEYLLERQCDGNGVSDPGTTPLHHAAFKGHLDIVVLLLRWGADLNVRSSEGHLPVDLAVHRGHVVVAAALRDEARLRAAHPDVRRRTAGSSGRGVGSSGVGSSSSMQRRVRPNTKMTATKSMTILEAV